MINIKGLLDADQQVANQQKKKNLFKLVQSGECILMVGAGCSATIHCSWLELMRLFTVEAQSIDPKFIGFREGIDDYLEFADRVKECIGEGLYYATIYNEYKEKPDPYYKKIHKVLCTLPFKGITTTNYDRMLEHALSSTNNGVHPDNSIWIDDGVEQAKIFEFLFSLNDKNAIKRIFHIHGISGQKQSIILSGEEYRNKYGFSSKPSKSSLYLAVKEGNLSEQQFDSLLRDHGLKWTAHRKILWSLLATRRVLFLGFSFSDPYFIRMLETVNEDLHTYGMENHFVVLSAKQENIDRAKMLKKKYGVEAIFYEDDQTHKGFERFIDEMAEAINDVPTDETVKEQTGPIEPPVPASQSSDLTKRLIQLSKERHNNED